MKIVLIGYMGSGKSTIGQALSEVTHMEFLDLDSVIERKEGHSIKEIFQTKGEIYFRKKEAVYLRETLSQNESLILALGGGTPCYGTVMQELLQREDVITVYLKASVDTLTERLLPEKSKRPLIAHLNDRESLNDFIRKHMFERKFYYMQSEVTIEIDGKDEKTLLEEIVLRLF